MDPILKQGEQSADDPLEFVLSDESVDRVGDIIRADGWKLSDFRKNPIALYGHNHKDVIGVWSNVRVEGKKLLGRLKLAKEGTSEFIDTIRSLVEQRIIKAVSVGAMPLEAEPRDPEKPWRGIDYKKTLLTEASLVAVPANPNALAVAKALSPDVAKKLFAQVGSDESSGDSEEENPGQSTSDFKTPNLKAARERARALGINV